MVRMARGNEIRIALVEDDDRVADGLVATIDKSERYRVHACYTTLAEARLHLPNQHIDILMVDLGLPDGDGVSLIRDVATNRPSVRILVFSAHTEERKVLRSLHAGAHGYVLKDASDFRLLETLDHLMDGGSPLTPSVAVCVLKHLKSLAIADCEDTRDNCNPLTSRETEVLTHIARGMSNAEIGDYLNVTINTVRAHTKSIFRKLSVHSRSAAIYRAVDDGIIEI